MNPRYGWQKCILDLVTWPSARSESNEPYPQSWGSRERRRWSPDDICLLSHLVRQSERYECHIERFGRALRQRFLPNCKAAAT